MTDLTPLYGTVIGLDVHLRQVTATALVVGQVGKLLPKSGSLELSSKVLGNWRSGAKA